MLADVFDFFNYSLSAFMYLLFWIFNPKTAGGGGQFDTPSGFSKNVSSKKSVKLWLFLTFNIIIRHIFAENFIEILLAV